MRSYIDSSVGLSILLGDKHAQRALELWSSATTRVSSLLFEAECLSVLRRQRNGDLARLDVMLEELSRKPFDGAVMDILRGNAALGGCRSLDAVHLATALYFQQASETPLQVCTFDDDMATVARKLGFTVAQ